MQCSTCLPHRPWQPTVSHQLQFMHETCNVPHLRPAASPPLCRRPQKQCDQLSVPCSVIALPKSIDNDFLLLDKTFGFETAVEEAQKASAAVCGGDREIK